ncbi:aKG-HExxH-type peptide beta-hydroxylase [Serratia symbiotica]|uniref:aKG-HExxH-type peptide beta-hydroxylase n=1 Tax=Serratia symbiotica TaxID=138074 RepID=UPI003313405D
MYQETKFIIDEIRLFSAKNVRAGSGFNTLGMVYISELSKDDDASRYIEHLIHESAHNLLYAYWANEALIENETDELFHTPFRKDKRPLSAIYHAMFVLYHTIFIFDRINQYDSNLIDFSKVRSNYNE